MTEVKFERVECCVCCEDVDPAQQLLLPCKHAYHAPCMNDWARHHAGQEVTCPQCRAPVSQTILQELQRPLSYFDMLVVPIMLMVMVLESLFGCLQAAFAWVRRQASNIKDALGHAISTFTSFVTGVAGAIAQSIESVYNMIWQSSASVFNCIGQHVVNFLSALGRCINSFVSAVESSISSYFSALAVCINSFLLVLGRWISSFLSALGSFVSRGTEMFEQLAARWYEVCTEALAAASRRTCAVIFSAYRCAEFAALEVLGSTRTLLSSLCRFLCGVYSSMKAHVVVAWDGFMTPSPLGIWIKEQVYLLVAWLERQVASLVSCISRSASRALRGVVYPIFTFVLNGVTSFLRAIRHYNWGALFHAVYDPIMRALAAVGRLAQAGAAGAWEGVLRVGSVAQAAAASVKFASIVVWQVVASNAKYVADVVASIARFVAEVVASIVRYVGACLQAWGDYFHQCWQRFMLGFTITLYAVVCKLEHVCDLTWHASKATCAWFLRYRMSPLLNQLVAWAYWNSQLLACVATWLGRAAQIMGHHIEQVAWWAVEMAACLAESVHRCGAVAWSFLAGAAEQAFQLAKSTLTWFWDLSQPFRSFFSTAIRWISGVVENAARAAVGLLENVADLVGRTATTATRAMCGSIHFIAKWAWRIICWMANFVFQALKTWWLVGYNIVFRPRCCVCHRGHAKLRTLCFTCAGDHLVPRCTDCGRGWCKFNKRCFTCLIDHFFPNARCCSCKQGWRKVGARCFTCFLDTWLNRCALCQRGYQKLGSCCLSCFVDRHVSRCVQCKRGYNKAGSMCFSCLCQRIVDYVRDPPCCVVCNEGYQKVGAECFSCCVDRFHSRCGVCHRGFAKVGTRCLTCYKAHLFDMPRCGVCQRGFAKIGTRCLSCFKEHVFDYPCCGVCHLGYAKVGTRCFSCLKTHLLDFPRCGVCRVGYAKIGPRCFGCFRAYVRDSIRNRPRCSICQKGSSKIGTRCFTCQRALLTQPQRAPQAPKRPSKTE